MADILKQVLQLIEIATRETTNFNEGREAAVAACRLIKKHRLLLEERPAQQPSTPHAARPSAYDVDLDFIMRNLNDLIIKQRTRPVGHTVKTRPSSSPPMGFEDVFGPDFDESGSPRTTPPPQPHVRGSSAFTPDPHAREIPIVGQQYCDGCHKSIKHGTFGMWSRGSVWHKHCWNAWNETFNPGG